MNCTDSVKQIPFYAQVRRAVKAHAQAGWLVGGFLRDTYRPENQTLRDFDFCIDGKPDAVAKAFSRSCKGTYIVLDNDEGSFRVVIKRRKRVLVYDFTRIRGANIEKDLRLRDFSINMLAVDILAQPKLLIDPHGAVKDIRRGIIRVVNSTVIAQDPLRILRAFSFVSKYGFRIESKTRALLIRQARQLKRTSPERITEELFKIVGTGNSARVIQLMGDMGVLAVLFPELSKTRGVGKGGYHHLDVWSHSIETVRQFEFLCRKSIAGHEDIQRYLDEEVAGLRTRRQIIKVACLLHDIGKPRAKKRLNKKTIFHTHEKIGRDMAEGIAVRLRLSLRTKRND